MNFSSDNATGIAPDIMEALQQANAGRAMAYGADDITTAATATIADLFEREVEVFPVLTGTAANALSLAAAVPPWGVTYCHRNAHIEEDEAGAPEFFTGGGKLALLDGPHGKFTAATLADALATAPFGVEHHAQPAAVSITQASEAGTCYTPDEIAQISAAAHKHELTVHMDGARFANAIAHLGCTPAEATWRAGIDILSFGATKNGAMAAEAVIVFDEARIRDLRFRRKRAGHLVSKMRFVSAQLLAYVRDDCWLRLARHANSCAQKLAQGLASIDGADLIHTVEANEIFIRLPEPVLEGMAADGVIFHRWLPAGPSVVRLVTAFDTEMSDIEGAIASARRHAGA